MEVTLPLPLTADLMATLVLKVRMSKEMRQLALLRGYEPEEVANLIEQELTFIAEQIQYMRDGKQPGG